MISLLKRNKRLIFLLLLTLLFFISGAVLLENRIELTGGLCLFSAFFTFFYLPISWLLRRFNYIQINADRWGKEVWGALILGGLLSFIGAVECSFEAIEFTLPFLLLWVFVGVLSALHLRKEQIRKVGSSRIDKQRIYQFAFWFFLFGIAITLIIFDNFRQDDALAITSVFYFPTLFFLVARWIFRQIKFIINLRSEQAKTELLHLKSQVNPHFFFNTLNNLYGLVAKDSKQARELILKLSDMMRYSIYEGEKEEVSLEEEVEYLKNYIELHRMRYHKDIEVEFDVDIQKEGIKVMPLLFIILLENAFKHGVENLIKDPYVHISIDASEKEIYFEVENNFDEKPQTNPPGIGLKNLKRRLELVYPKRHQLSFLKTENIYKANLSIKL